MTAEQQLELHHKDAYHWARQCCRFDTELAGEVLQDSYLKILEGKAVFQHKSSFKTWLYSVIRFTAIDALDKTSKANEIHRLLSDDFADTPETANQPYYEKLIEGLPPRQSEVLLLVFYHDLTIEAAAQILGIGLGTARTHYDRGKKNLKDQILKSGLRNAI